MPKVLIVGCGDLGGAVAGQLVQLGIQTAGVKRSAGQLDGVSMMQADVTKPESLKVLKKTQPEILIYCVAANGQTDEQYKTHYVDGLRNVLVTQSENTKLKHVFFVSSTRVYGQADDAVLDETIAAIPADFGGKRLLEAERLLDSMICSSTILRLSGIYGAGRLRMINLAKSPENWPAKNSWTNRIHRDDAAAFIVHLIKNVLPVNTVNTVRPCYIVTDSKPVSQYEVLRWIATQLHTNIPVSINPPVEGGKRLSNQAMLATGLILQYPDYQTGYQALLTEYFINQTSTL